MSQILKSIVCVMAFVVTASWLPGAFAQSLLITGARVLAPTGDRLLEGRVVLMRDGRIVEIAPGATYDKPADASVIDASGLTLIPGLIDLHTHLLLHPYDEASWNDQVLRESLALRTARAVAQAKATLYAGFTTIRELGTEGAGFADVGLRDAIAQGIVPGPRILAATKAIVATGAYGPAGFDPRWTGTMPKGAQMADGVAGVRKAARQQIAAGADWVKVYADYRRRPGDPSTPTFSLDELKAIVDEATSAGLPVAAHASTNEAIRRAVLAGVKTIEHGYEASSDVLKLMRDHGVALCPTLAASEAVARYGGWTPDKPDDPRIAQAKALMQRALASGVIIANGSDAGVFSHGDNAHEIELLVDYGMTPAQALAAATSVAAGVLGESDSRGKVAAGYIADLVLLEGNPLEDIHALRNVQLVFKNGAVVHDARHMRK